MSRQTLKSAKSMITRTCNKIKAQIEEGEALIIRDLFPPTSKEECEAEIREIKKQCDRIIAHLEVLNQKLEEYTSGYSKSIATYLEQDNADNREEAKDFEKRSEEAFETLSDSLDMLGELKAHRASTVADLESHATKLRGNLPSAPNADASLVAQLQALSTRQTESEPRLSLQPFNSDPTKWHAWKAVYDELIHNKTTISDIRKLTHLMGCLQGEAKTIAQNFEYRADNYALIYAKLNERFGDEKQVIVEMLRRLDNAKSEGHHSSAQRKLANEVLAILAQLRMRNHKSIDDSPFMWDKILDKFNRNIRNTVIRDQVLAKKHGTDWTVEMFQTALETAVSIEELENPTNANDNLNRGQSFKRPSPNNHNFKPTHNSEFKSEHVTHYRRDTKPGNGMKPKFACTFCGETNHKTYECKSYTTNDARIRKLRVLGRCTKCARTGHFAKNCTTDVKCNLCSKQHYSWLCWEVNQADTKSTSPNRSARVSDIQHTQASKKTTVNVTQTETSRKQCNERHQTRNGHLWMGKVHAESKDPLKSRDVYALFDTCSQRTYADEKFVREMNAKRVGKDNLAIETCGTEVPINRTVNIVELFISNHRTQKGKKKILASTLPRITGSANLPKLSKEDWTYIHRHKLPMAIAEGESEGKPDILIGTDYLHEFLTGGEKVELPSGKILFPTTLGFICIHDTSKVIPPKSLYTCLMNTRKEENADTCEVDPPVVDDQLVEEAEPTEFIGPLREEKALTDKRILEEFEKHLQVINEGGKQVYSCRLPWCIDESNQIPDNRSIALRRLESVQKSMKDKPELWSEYEDTLLKQLEDGTLEEIDEKTTPDGPRVIYLPHQPVITPHKSTTLRIVLDASSHFKNKPSLNDALHQGPSFIPSIIGTLIRFRMHNAVLTSDIAKAFLQIRVDEKDRDACRILWLKDRNKPPSPDNLRIFRYRVVLFGLICSPFLLAATIRYHLRHYPMPEELKEELIDNLYVDNSCVGSASTEEIVKKYKLLKETFESAGMNLRAFVSNDAEAMKSIAEIDRGDPTDTKILGIRWSADTDTLTVPELAVPQIIGPLTRRKVVKYLNQQFDPLGWRIPHLLSMKLFYRKLCDAGCAWDDQVPDELAAEFFETCEKMKTESIEIRRCVELPGNLAHAHQIILFTDASKQGIGAAAYLRNPRTRECNLLLAKSALANPEMTIPKKEMDSVRLGAEMAKFLVDELSSTINITQIILFSDNSACIGMLKKPRTANTTFFRNRLNKIATIAHELELNGVDFYFGHVETESNIADILTRPFKDTAHWWHGPEFLHETEDLMSARELHLLTDTEGEPAIETVTNLLQVKHAEDEPSNDPRELSRSNSLNKNVRIFAYCLRFIKGICTKLKQRKPDTDCKSLPSITRQPTAESTAITLAEFREAKREIIRCHQRSFITKEFRKAHVDLDLFQDKYGVWRCGGRFQYAELVPSAKHPIIIAPRTRLSRLIIRHVHNNGHKGHDHTTQDVRLIYWIPKLRSEIKMSIRRCIECQKANNLPFRYPDMGQLPSDRVCTSRPFQNVGLDYLGPIKVRSESKEIEKAYVLLITCTTTRLVHLECVLDMTTASFLNALRRFFSRRGVPEKITSDNAPTFLLGEDMTREAIEGWKVERDTALNKMLLDYETEWRHIIAHAPWMGGFYERLVRSVKSAFFKTFGKKILNIDSLITAMTEIEGILNGRPLTYRTSDSLTLLRPCDFMQLHSSLYFPFEHLNEPDDYLPAKEEAAIQTRKQATKALESSIKTVEKFWEIWRNFYLTDLREKHKLRMDKRAGSAIEPRLGQVVLISNEMAKRNDWTLGRIVKLLRGKDGEIRGASVKTGNGSFAERPINLLVPLELDDKEFLEEAEAGKLKSAKSSKVPTTDTPRYNFRERRRINYAGEIANDPTALCLTSIIHNRSSRNFTQRYGKCARSSCPISALCNVLRVLTTSTLLGSTGLGAMASPTTTTTADFCSELDCIMCADNFLNPYCHPLITVPLLSFIFAICIVGILYVILLIFATGIKKSRSIFASVRNWRSNTPQEIELQDTTPKTRKRLPETRKNRTFTGAQVGLREDEHERLQPQRAVDEDEDTETGGEIRPTRERSARKSRFGPVTGIMIVVMLAGCLVGTTRSAEASCQNAFAISSEIVACTKEAGNESKCNFTSNTMVDLDELDRRACISFSHRNETIGTLSLTWKGIQRTCEEEDLYWTRESHTNFTSTKRCPMMGSCKGPRACLDFLPNASIAEFEDYNHFPHISYCEESCGGIGCGCGGTASGCLFTTIFAKPTSDEIYRISRCMSFEDATILSASWSTNDKTAAIKADILLPLGQQQKLGPFTISAGSFLTTDSYLLHEKFLTSDASNSTTAWPEHVEPVLRCQSREEARTTTNCTLRDTCRCKPAEIGSNCLCADIDLVYDIRSRKHRQLPIRTAGLTLSRAEDGKLIAVTTHNSQSRIDIVGAFKADQLIETTTHDKCWVEPKSANITGCYRCQPGATLSLNCSSSFYDTIATISCGQIWATAPCRPGGTIYNGQVHVSDSHIDAACTVACGRETTSFQLRGRLAYQLEKAYGVPKYVKGNWKGISEGITLPSLTGILMGMSDSPIILGGSIILIGIALAAIVRRMGRRIKSQLCICILLLLLAPPTISSPGEPSPPGECSKDDSHDEIVQTESRPHPRIIYRSDSPPIINIDYKRWERMKKEREQKARDRQ